VKRCGGKKARTWVENNITNTTGNGKNCWGKTSPRDQEGTGGANNVPCYQRGGRERGGKFSSLRVKFKGGSIEMTAVRGWAI